MLRWSTKNLFTPCVIKTTANTAARAAASSILCFPSTTPQLFFANAAPLQFHSLRLSSDLATSNPNLAPMHAGDAAAAAAAGTTTEGLTAHATEVARRVNATKRAHQTATGDERKRLEQAAWNYLNTLTEDQIANADGQATAILLNAWGYFARFWARGKEGPL